ncbi:sensor histidine kinase [Acinetobacter terrae]|uniref:sensor histidine kinase n=1 Tax=Acinetobacter terrae TaxID=2731247 RepID=UPI0007D878A1|nr:ATP-binding protein [Acinetobacter terrae]OAL83115.1 transcriptional regulator [Acinetobacter terrae]
MNEWKGTVTSSNDLANQHQSISLSEQQQMALQFQLYCTENIITLSQMKNLSTGLPGFLQRLKQEFPQQGIPEYGLVLCYPFTQECFIFHALEQSLTPADVVQIRHHLLGLSSSICMTTPKQQHSLEMGRHQAKLLLMGHEFVVWRLYFFQSSVQQHLLSYLRLLDDSMQRGLEYREQQQHDVQATLQKERREFSADLHDSIAQILGFLRIKSAQLHQQCKNQSQYSALLEPTEELATYTHYAYQQTRDLITASRLAYQELDFLSALKKVIQEFERQSSIAFVLDNRVSRLTVSASQSVQLLYIIRESLSNIVRHSHASTAHICLENKIQQQLNIHVMDDGRGINSQLKRYDSFGLEIMQERAERIGATLEIRKNMPQGTCVSIRLETKNGE